MSKLRKSLLAFVALSFLSSTVQAETNPHSSLQLLAGIPAGEYRAFNFDFPLDEKDEEERTYGLHISGFFKADDGGIQIDAFRKTTSPADFQETDFPWLVRTRVVMEALRHRVFLMRCLRALGAERNFQPPAVLLAYYDPASGFGHFKDEVTELNSPDPLSDPEVSESVRKSVTDERAELRTRIVWSILYYAQKLAPIDLEIEETLSNMVLPDPPKKKRWEFGPLVSTRERWQILLERRARIEAYAPQILNVASDRSYWMSKSRTLLTELKEKLFFNSAVTLPAFFQYELPRYEQFLENGAFPSFPDQLRPSEEAALVRDIALPLIRDAFLNALAQNTKVLEYFAASVKEEQLDSLLYLQSNFFDNIFSEYSDYDEVFRRSLESWRKRAADRFKEKRQRESTQFLASLVAFAVGSLTPVSWGVVPAWALTLARGGGAASLINLSWNHYWDVRRHYNRVHALHAASPFFITAGQFQAALNTLNETELRSILEISFILPTAVVRFGQALAYWRHPSQGKIPLFLFQKDFWGVSPQGLTKVMDNMEKWERTSQIAIKSPKTSLGDALYHLGHQLRLGYARRKIATIQARLRTLESTHAGTPLGADAARALSAERPALRMAGLRFHWSDEAERVMANWKGAIPTNNNPLHGSQWTEALRLTGQFLRRLKREPSQTLRASAKAMKANLTNPVNLATAWSSVLTQCLTVYVIQTFAREGELNPDGSVPAGPRVDLTVTAFTLGVMAFAAPTTNVVLRVLPSMTVAGIGSTIGQAVNLGGIENISASRVAYDVAFNAAAMLAVFPRQMRLAYDAMSLGRRFGASASYGLYRGAWATSGYIVLNFYCWPAMFLFERGNAPRDRFGNYFYRDTTSPYFVVNSAYRKEDLNRIRTKAR